MSASNTAGPQLSSDPASEAAAAEGPANSKNGDKTKAERLAKLVRFQQKQATKVKCLTLGWAVSHTLCAFHGARCSTPRAGLKGEPTRIGKPKPKAAPKEKKEKKPKTEKAPEPEYSNTTPAGEKKAYRLQLQSSCRRIGKVRMVGEEVLYLGRDGKSKPEGLFVVPAPPPNIIGSLHIGQVLTVAIQVSLIQ
ncbi:hypothetical protein BC938DRAFT_478613, partial [Jimgerdemannia flammicorona]